MAIRTAVVGLVSALALAVPSPPAAQASSTHDRGQPGRTQALGKLTVGDRTFITDERGRALQLRGFNAGKWADDRVTERDVREMARLGFNFMRLIVQWQHVEPQRDRYDRAYLAYVDRVLGWGDRYGVRVMIDMHQDVYGPYFNDHNGMPAWTARDDGLPFEANPDDWFQDYFQPGVMAAFNHLYDDADLRAEQAEMWRVLVRSVRGHRSLLGYDLFNEPFGQLRDGEDLPTFSARLETTQIADMYRRVIKAIRSEDRRSWVFVEPTVLVGFGVPTQLPGFDDPRVGYAPHFYDASVETGGDWDPSNGFIENYEAAIGAYAAEHKMPLVVGEWGPPTARTPGNAQLVTDSVAAMNRFASGWAMFYWCRGGSGYCQLDSDGNSAPGTEPAFAPYARAIAGKPVSEVWDQATRTLTLSWRANSGVTEVSVPGGRAVISGPVRYRWDQHRDVVHLSPRHHGLVTVTIRQIGSPGRP